LLLRPSLGVNMLVMMSERLRQTELRKQNAALARQADELGRSKQAADAATRAKADLLAGMSHELRTPLSGIIGLTELVLGTNLTSSQREYLELVRESGELLLTLINDVLDMSKIEAGRMQFDIQPLELRDRLIDTLKTLVVRANRKGVELCCRVDPAVPDRLLGDMTRLRQVVVNLVGNAIKFTARGEIVVEIRVAERSEKAVTLQFSIRDTGMGIPKEKLALLFQPYVQADAGIARDYGGTGLGLSISAGLVSGMGGRIWAESTVGVGSVFHFTVPLAIDATVGQAVTPSLSGRMVMLIEPHPTSAGILSEMLSSWGMDVMLESDAVEASNLLAKTGSSYSYLIACDRTGEDLNSIQRMRDRHSLATIVLLSADPVDVGARCDELQLPHLLKPVKPSDLLNLLTTRARPAAAPAVQAAPAPEIQTPRASLKILLAEDGLVNQKLALSLLGKQGHEVTVAPTGRQVLEAIGREKFDLVLMDLAMPEMDGVEATRAIRASEEGTPAHLPIIAMTASNYHRDVQRCLTAGMDAYVTKPVRAEVLQATIADVLGADRASNGVVDWPAALRYAENQPDALEERVALLLQELPRVESDLAAAATAHDYAALRIAAHTIRVALQSFGAPRIAPLAQQLELLSQSPEPAVDDLLSKLHKDIQRLMVALKHFAGGST
jgi:signal transduction histidine kinase/CheY-like chemotaxis protein/HPt (histidine-containing phosphotransfer) domain-containing protein